MANNPDTYIKPYLLKQANVLSQYHNLHTRNIPVKDRTFFHIPDKAHCNKHSLNDVRHFLVANAPAKTNCCFVHGDFHYANMLWENGNISCVLDFELSGIGIREFDMAWSIVIRPGQAFANSRNDVQTFLSGYENQYCFASFCFYYTQIAIHFYSLGDANYQQNVRKLIDNAVNSHHVYDT